VAKTKRFNLKQEPNQKGDEKMLKEIEIDGIKFTLRIDQNSQRVITKPSGKKVIIYDSVIFCDAKERSDYQ
jgi:hypothetical protein